MRSLVAQTVESVKTEQLVHMQHTVTFYNYYFGRALQWARALRRDDLAELSADYLHRYCYVCARHFVPSMMNAHKSRLLHHAVPTVDICVGNSTATMSDHEPDSHIKTVSPLAGKS